MNEMRDNSKEINFARCEHSEQPVHQPGLIEVMRCAQKVAKELSHPKADRENTAQTRRVTSRLAHE